MPSRKPPSQRNPEYAVTRMNRQLQSMAPGTMGGRAANASPIDFRSTQQIAIFSGGGVGGASSTPEVGGNLRFVDVGLANHVSLQGASNPSVAEVQFGQGGPTLSNTPDLNISFNGRGFVAGSSTVSGTLNVSMSAFFGGNLSAGSTATVQDTLTVGGTLTARALTNYLGELTLGDVEKGTTSPGIINSRILAGSKHNSYALVSDANGDTQVNGFNVLRLKRRDVNRLTIGATGTRLNTTSGDDTAPRAFLDVAGSAIVGQGGETLKLSAEGGSDSAFLSFYARTAAPLQRTAVFGFDTPGGTTLSLRNELINGDINFITDGTGRAKVNGQRIYRAGQGREDGVVDADIAFDTIMGGGGAGVGSIAHQAVFGWNIRDGSVTYDKLSAGAIASIQSNPSAYQGRDRFFRFVTNPPTGQQDTNQAAIGNLAGDQAPVADGLAFNGFALTSSGLLDNAVIMSGPRYGYNPDTSKGKLDFPNQGPGLAPGNYRATVYVRLSSVPAGAAGDLPAFGVTVRDARGTAVVSENGAVVEFTPNQVGSTNYVGVSIPFTLVGDTYTTVAGEGLDVQVLQRTAAGVTTHISHVSVEMYNPLAPGEVTTTFIRDASITTAKVRELSASRIASGVIEADDIRLGPSGRIWAGTSLTADRVELNSAGIFGYNPSAVALFQLNANGNFTLRSGTTGARMLMNTGGIQFYNASGLTVDLNATNGDFTLQSGIGNTNVMRLSAAGLNLFTAGGVNTVSLRNNGTFTLQSSDVATASRMEITSAGIKGYNGSTLKTFLDSATGQLEFFSGTAGGSRVVFNSLGVEGYSGTSRVTFLDAATGRLSFASPVNSSGYRIELDASGLRLTNGTTTTVNLSTATGSGTFTGNITASTIDGGTITGALYRSRASGARVEIDTNAGGGHVLRFFTPNSAAVHPLLYSQAATTTRQEVVLDSGYRDIGNQAASLRLTSGDTAQNFNTGSGSQFSLGGGGGTVSANGGVLLLEGRSHVSVNGPLYESVGSGNQRVFSPNNPPPYPVTSVNGRTGAVTGLAEAHNHDYAATNHGVHGVSSVNGRTGAVSGLAEAHGHRQQDIHSSYLQDGELRLRGINDANHSLQYGGSFGDGPLLSGWQYFGVRMMHFGGGGVVVMRLDSAGNLFVRGSGNFNQSTIRGKKDVVAMPAADGLGKIGKFRAVRYKDTEIEPDVERVGVIAEEVYDVAPELVMLDDTGRPLAVNYAGFVPYLIKAIQDLSAKVDLLEARRPL